MWCRWLLMGESWVIMTQKCSPLITSFDRLPALPTTSKHTLYKGKKVNTDVASEDLDDDSLAERALRGVLWFRFKINKFSLCELVQQNLKSWLETTHKEGCLKHQWTLLLHITEHMYQSTREPPTSVTNITKWMGQYWSVKIMKNIIAKVDKIIKLKT